MTVPPKAKAGDAVEILIGRDWHAATVESVGYWSHSSGNCHPVYTLIIGGDRIHCGNNSLRRPTDGGAA